MAILKSPLPRVDFPDIGLHQYIFKDFGKFKDRIALIDDATEEKLTYGGLKHGADRIASGLKRHGVRRGDIFAIIDTNSIDFVRMFFGAISAGAVVTTVNPSYTPDEIQHQLDDSNALFVYTKSDRIQAVKEACKATKIKPTLIVSGSADGCISLEKLLNDDGSHYPNDFNINPRDLACLPYSSGTTGRPKGTMLTHRNIVAALETLRTIGNETEVHLGLLPFFHNYGLVFLVCRTLLLGQTLLIMERFNAERFLQAIQKYKISLIMIVPPLVIFLSKSPLVDKYDLSALRFVFSGAAPIGSDTIQDLHRRLPHVTLVQGWGMTEIMAVGTRQSDGFLRESSAGVMAPNMEGKIVDVATGKVLGANETGELWVRGPNVFVGYWKRPLATKETITEDGWLRTGDVAYFDKDGFLYIVDRIKELIKVKGFQVAPAELEDVLVGHAGIGDAAVVGISDPESGEVPKAFIVRKDHSITAGDIHAYVNKKVAYYKRLKGGIEFVKEIPKSTSGKILRRELRRKTTASKL